MIKNIKKTEASSVKSVIKRMSKCWELYLFLLPAVVLVAIFSYAPMYGILLAFKEYIPGTAIADLPWAGFTHFKRLFAIPDFGKIVWNTVKVSFFSNLFTFPLPVIFALLLNQVGNVRYKKLIQNVTYIPHLFSTVVVMSIATLMLSPSTGIINKIIQWSGGSPVLFFGEDKYVIPLWIMTDIWQNLGYGAVVYIAALAGVDQSQIEAARIDGCSRIKIIWHIELPAIAGTIITMQILRWGQMFNIGTDKMLLIQTPLNLNASEVLSTYIYKVGLLDGQFGFSTAVNLFNTLVNIFCLLVVNKASKKFSETSLF